MATDKLPEASQILNSLSISIGYRVMIWRCMTLVQRRDNCWCKAYANCSIPSCLNY
ncbi:MAG: hypothetical protein HNEKOMLI_00855 [Sodalis sp. Psp]|nr:hypothetical protein [Sodalis sp. Psp]MCR3757172.1 hypothetical protein [Sodalis sp. Ppy]